MTGGSALSWEADWSIETSTGITLCGLYTLCSSSPDPADLRSGFLELLWHRTRGAIRRSMGPNNLHACAETMTSI